MFFKSLFFFRPTSKYIESLKKAAEVKQREFQLVEERKAHREREEEGTAKLDTNKNHHVPIFLVFFYSFKAMSIIL